MNTLNEDFRNLMDLMRSSMTTDDMFFHAMNQIARQLPKIQRLRQDEEVPGQLKKEIAEVSILASIMREIGNVNDGIISEKVQKIIQELKENNGRPR